MANADRDGPQEVLDAEVFADVDRWKVYNRFSGIVEFVRVSRRWRAMSRLVAQSTFLALEGFFLGGAAGNGFVAVGTNGEFVIFFGQLPFRHFALRLPHEVDELAP